MEMKLHQVARVAKNMLQFFSKDWTVESLLKLEGSPQVESVDDDHQGEDAIIISRHPRSPGTVVVNYFRRTGQTPLAVIINPSKDYIKVMITADRALPGYEVFDEVPEFGKLQDKALPLDFGALKKELEALSQLKENEP